jgi:hypothetical protein
MEFNPKKFKKLPLALRYKTVEEKGKYLMHRRHLNYVIELFQLNGRYIEVWRSMATNQIYWIECAESGYVVEKYLQKVNVESLLGEA